MAVTPPAAMGGRGLHPITEAPVTVTALLTVAMAAAMVMGVEVASSAVVIATTMIIMTIITHRLRETRAAAVTKKAAAAIPAPARIMTIAGTPAPARIMGDPPAAAAAARTPAATAAAMITAPAVIPRPVDSRACRFHQAVAVPPVVDPGDCPVRRCPSCLFDFADGVQSFR